MLDDLLDSLLDTGGYIQAPEPTACTVLNSNASLAAVLVEPARALILNSNATRAVVQR